MAKKKTTLKSSAPKIQSKEIIKIPCDMEYIGQEGTEYAGDIFVLKLIYFDCNQDTEVDADGCVLNEERFYGYFKESGRWCNFLGYSNYQGQGFNEIFEIYKKSSSVDFVTKD